MGLWIQTMWYAHAELRPALLQQLHRLTSVSLWQKRLAAALSAAGLSWHPPLPVQACPHQGGPCPVFLLPDAVIKIFSEVGFAFIRRMSGLSRQMLLTSGFATITHRMQMSELLRRPEVVVKTALY